MYRFITVVPVIPGKIDIRMEFLKSITGKAVTALLVLGVVAGGISWWQMDPETRQSVISGAGKIAGWFGVVLAIPWATFYLIGKVARIESNLAGALLVGGYTILETVLLAWLFDWQIQGAAAWTFLFVGGLFAAAYNLFTCDWIAEKVA